MTDSGHHRKFKTKIDFEAKVRVTITAWLPVSGICPSLLDLDASAREAAMKAAIGDVNELSRTVNEVYETRGYAKHY